MQCFVIWYGYSKRGVRFAVKFSKSALYSMDGCTYLKYTSGIYTYELIIYLYINQYKPFFSTKMHSQLSRFNFISPLLPTAFKLHLQVSCPPSPYPCPTIIFLIIFTFLFTFREFHRVLARTRAVVLLPFTFVLNLTLSNKLFSYFPRSVTVWACSQLGKAPPVTNNCWQNVTESPGSGFVFPVDVWILHWRWVIHTTCWFSLLYRSSGLVWVFNPESIWLRMGMVGVLSTGGFACVIWSWMGLDCIKWCEWWENIIPFL